MKTPDEIKKGLECCSVDDLHCGPGCPYKDDCLEEARYKGLESDALEYIQQLEAENEAYKHAASKCCYESRCNAQIKELETLGRRLMDEKKQLERERDAAVDDLQLGVCCETCIYADTDANEPPCATCALDYGFANWQWRGVKEEPHARD